MKGCVWLLLCSAYAEIWATSATSWDAPSPLTPIQLLGLHPHSGGWPAGLEMTPAIEFMLHRINQQQSILPGYNVSIAWFDSACSGTTGRKRLTESLLGSSYVGLIGDGCSGSCMALAELAPIYNLPQISTACSFPDLSNREVYPTFFRTMTPDTKMNDVWARFARDVGYTEVAVLHRKVDAYAVRTLSDTFSKMGIKLGLTEVIDQSRSDLKSAVQRLIRTNIRPVVLIGHDVDARRVMCELLTHGRKYHLFMQRGWRKRNWYDDADSLTSLWSEGYDPSVCSASAMAEIASQSLYGLTQSWSADPDLPYTCDPSMTSGQFKKAMETTQNRFMPGLTIYEGRNEIANAGDALCTWMLTLRHLLVERKFAPAEIVCCPMDPSVFAAVNSFIQNASFSGFTGEVRFTGADKDADSWGEQWHADGSHTKILTFSVGTGDWTSVGDFRWDQSYIRETYFPRCPEGTEADIELNLCVECRDGTEYDQAVGACRSCPVGFGGRGGRCEPCPPGSFQSLDGQSNCTLAHPGYFQTKALSSVEEPCPPGTFSGAEGASQCQACPIGTFADSSASSSCATCPDTFTTEFRATQRPEKCTCKEGTFWNRRDDTCDVCQPGGQCPGGFGTPTMYTNRYGVYVGTVAPEQVENKQAGDYSRANDAFTKLLIYNCRPGQCEEQPEKCGPLRQSVIACAICKEGHYRAECVECGAGGSAMPFILLIIGIPAMWAGCVASAKPYAAKATAAFQLVSTFGIMAVFMQMLGALKGFNISWPFGFGYLFDIGNIFLLDLEGLGVGCLVGNGFAPQYYAAFLLPVLIAACIAVVLAVSNAIPSIGGHATKIHLDASLNFLGMVYSALYISLVKLVVAYFECVPNPAAGDTLAKYKQIECNGSEHLQATVGMIFGMVFYVIGFFSLCLYLNVKAPDMFANARFRNRCKFLVNRWRVDVWYWGSVYMARNLCLALVAVASSTAVDQFIMMGVVMVVFLVLSSSYMPWKDAQLAQFDNTVSLVVTFAVYCGVGFMHLLAVKEFYPPRDTSELAREVREDCDARMATFSYLLASALGLTAVLFAVLLIYCVWWAKHAGKIAEEDAEMKEMLLERWTITLRHKEFFTQFNRYIETGTHHDVKCLVDFLNNMQARFGGVDRLGPLNSRLATAIKKTRGTARLRMTQRLSDAAQRLSGSMLETETPADQTVPTGGPDGKTDGALMLELEQTDV